MIKSKVARQKLASRTGYCTSSNTIQRKTLVGEISLQKHIWQNNIFLNEILLIHRSIHITLVMQKL